MPRAEKALPATQETLKTPAKEKPPAPKRKVAAEFRTKKSEAEEQEIAKRTAELREKIHPSAKKLHDRSQTERDLAHSLITEFGERLHDKDIQEAEMDHYGHQLMEIRDRLEALQADARRVPPSDIKDNTIEENHAALENIEAAIRASKMTPRIARSEIKFGAGVRKHELEKETAGKQAEEEAKGVLERIQQKYGAHPEDLMGGRLPGIKGFFKGLKFRFLNSMAHIAGMESDYDLYRQALREAEQGELAREERIPHERRRQWESESKAKEKTRSAAEKKAKAKTAAELEEEILGESEVKPKKAKTKIKPLEEWTDEYQLLIDVSPPMTVEKAGSLVRYADKLWNLVDSKIEEGGIKSGALAIESSKAAGSPDPATYFVFTMARYLEAKRALQKDDAEIYLKKIMDMSKLLEIENNALLQSIIATTGRRGTAKHKRI
ncbi:hypothetical protein KKF59_04685 [Patescibacteria group bacterium]|nr:hypothetical protein [Patescibacteria group bacterium]